mgnify:CR=1 FL=1
MKIFLDDVRHPLEGYVHLTTVEDCIKTLESQNVTDISFDHDLGTEKTGYDLAKWIEEQAFHNTLKRLNWTIHSANPTGRENIVRAMTNADKFWSKHAKS